MLATSHDLVVLLSEDGNPVGSADRSRVHDANTPLHLGFSAYLFNAVGQVLVTRRALSKRTFPGVWTNSFCGHPRPGEALTAAVHRYAQLELGVEVSGVSPALPDFRYRATDASGVVENEICPVLIARTDDDVAANPDEVQQWRWVAPGDLVSTARTAPWAISPWSREQIPLLHTSGHLGS